MELITIPSSGSSIDKYSQPILADSKLTKSEIIIYDASTKQKIMYLSEAEKARIANTIISMAKVRLSLKDRAKHEDSVESQMIFSDLNKFDFLTESEVLLALENGLDGSYLKEHESNVFWNPSNFVLWIKRYLLEKNDVMRKVTNAKPAEQVIPVPNDEVLKKMAIDNANFHRQMLIEYNNGNSLLDWKSLGGLSSLYSDLKKFGIFKINEDEQNRIMEKYKHLKGDDFVMMCRREGYKFFIQMLVDFDSYIDNNGKIKPIA
jgi:hypothetical protein